MAEFDCIIVGAGSAGCVLAERLSADGRRRVLVLEAGGSDRRFWIRTPIGYGKTFFDGRVNWKFRTGPEPGLAGRASYWPRGKVVGGSSSINAMVYMRGLPRDFDDWRDAGNPGWGWADVAPVFARIERHVAGDGSATGDGPLWVSEVEPQHHPIRRYFFAAAAEIGLPVAPGHRLLDGEGVGAYRITTQGGRRCSAADAFLRPALRRANLTLMTGAHVTRVIFEGRRAVAVEVATAGGTQRIAAAAEIILAAGAVGSPQLLQLSGVGPGALLQSLGISVVHANDAVGAGLQDHLGVNYLYRAREPTLNGVLGTWPGRIRAGVQYLVSRTGPLSLSINQAGGLVRTRPDSPHPDTQLYFNPLSYSTNYGDRRPLTKPDPWPGFILSFNPCRPTSRGRIEIASPDPAAPPLIFANYLATDEDVANVIASARLIGRLQNTAAMRKLIATPPAVDPAAIDDDAVLADFRARSGTVFHPCGTCRMAPVDAGGVVDAALKVHGVDGLRVVDASVFPNVTSANTNAPAVMLAARAADLILEET